MKNFKTVVFFICATFSLCLFSCQDTGDTLQNLNGTELGLPDELKGLKIYTVFYNDGVSSAQVAVLDDRVNSVSYTSGKTKKSTIIINKNDNSVIEVSQILVENDSMIVCRK